MKYDASKIKKYYFHFRKSIKFFYFILAFSTFFMLGLVWIFHDSSQVEFWILLATILSFSILQALIFWRISRPQINLSKVIFGVSNKISIENLPIPQEKDFFNSGFSEVLKFIYFIDVKGSSRRNKKNSKLPEIINNAKVDFIVLNSKGKKTFVSLNAPDFKQIRNDKMQEILDWIEDSRKNKIRNSKIWERVSNKFEKSEDQKLFDIAVFFEKQFEQDVVIFFIDKTDIYEHDENDLNFIAFAAHEIRGPITIIRGYLDLLSNELETLLSPTQKELFLRLIVSSNKLSGYINNILNVAKFDQNRLEFSPKKLQISRIFDEINEDIQNRASAQNRELQVKIPHNLPEVSADIYGASEVLVNLIDNAIKYSNDGGLVEIWAEESGDFVEVSVRDYGIGIPNSVIKNLFSKFYRSHRSRETVAGSGIGLYISKAIIEIMGGKIWAVSKEGKGSTFTVALPIFEKVDANSKNTKASKNLIQNHGKIM